MRVRALAVLALSGLLLPRPAAALDLAKARAIDLSYSLDAHTLYWPSSPSGFELKTLHRGRTDGGYFYVANAFCAPEHGGTHLDAPLHFAEGKRGVDEIPLTQLIAPAVVIDVSVAAAADPDYRLSAKDVTAWEAKHGRIEAGAIVLLRTGWGRRWPDRKQYFGSDTPGDAEHLHFPSYGVDAARLLVAERKAAALGVDTASIDYGPSADFAVHQLANGADVPGLENVANLDQVPERGAWILALPMKIAGGSGAPLRLVALVPR
jgi:kynurenine formamidase